MEWLFIFVVMWLVLFGAAGAYDFKKDRGKAKDKPSVNHCPNCDAYDAWLVDRQKYSRKCEVCGQEYPLVA